MPKHNLEENTIRVWREASGEARAGTVEVSARCACGYSLRGTGSTLLEAVEDLEARFSEHLASVTPPATPGGAGVGGLA